MNFFGGHMKVNLHKVTQLCWHIFVINCGLIDNHKQRKTEWLINLRILYTCHLFSYFFTYFFPRFVFVLWISSDSFSIFPHEHKFLNRILKITCKIFIGMAHKHTFNLIVFISYTSILNKVSTLWRQTHDKQML